MDMEEEIKKRLNDQNWDKEISRKVNQVVKVQKIKRTLYFSILLIILFEISLLSGNLYIGDDIYSFLADSGSDDLMLMENLY